MIEKLRAAQKARTLVRFERRVEEGHVTGFVLDVGPEFFLMSWLGEDIRLEGFYCFRYADISSLRAPAPHEAFVKAALRKRGMRVPARPRVDLESVHALLESAAKLFPLLVIQRERVNPDVCWIGRVLQVDDETVSIREIDPDATWHAEPTTFRLSDITQVSFGGGYEEALYLVGGEPRK